MSWCHIYYITSVILYIYSRYVTASEYYVSAAPNGEDCPFINTPCHNLSHYIANYLSYFTNDTIFYFLNGTHTPQCALEINNVSNITLQGLGHIEQGFHETVMQSTSVIRCSDSNGTGIQFINSSDVELKSLTIANCGFNWHQHYSVSLYFVNINNVTLDYVSVQNSSGDGLFLLNTYGVLIANSSFVSNGDLEAFVGNVYIIYYDKINRLSRVNIFKSNFTLGLGYGIYLKCDNEAEIIIESSMFSNNIGQYGGGVDISLLGGGGVEFSNCTIYNNTALNGGGMYIAYYGNGSVDINNCNIYNNTAQNNGGGVSVYSTGGGSIEFINCSIYDNTAQFHGGGMYITSNAESGSIEFSNSTIYNNSAYFASGLVLRSFQTSSTLTSSFRFTNVMFHFNKVMNRPDVCQKGYQAAVVLLNIDNVTFDQINVSNHNTTGLVAENSLITFNSHNMFVNNSGIYGGGIALYELSQLLLNQNANVSFVNNHARKSGGGIFVSQFLSVDIGPPHCSFKVIPYHDPNDTETVLYFVNNTADISGDVLYGGKIDDCTSPFYFDHLFYYPQQTGLSVVSSDPIQVCFCESNQLNCSITNISIFAIPGIDVRVSLATVGIQNGLTKSVINLNSSDDSSIVQCDNNRLNAICTNLSFTLIKYSSLNATQIYVTLERENNLEHVHENYTKVIEVTIEPCPNGFPLVNGKCSCRPELTSGSITCDINTQIITRDGDMWIGYENNSHCLIVYPNCPFHYCNNSNISFTLNYPSKQCLHSRSGILCGQCSKGFSLTLGYNQCERCTNDHIPLIIPFALAGIALVAFVITLNLTVSVGTINGLIFYANVVKIYEHIFFPNGHVTFLSQFISWINLDLGINTCFYHNMDSCSKAFFQFAFPAYILFIVMLIIILLQYSSKVACVGRQAIPALATIILLSYTKLIRTVIQALYFTNIQCSDNKNNTVTLLRWYNDPNIQYLGGCHIPLFLFSVAVFFLFIVPYTFYLLTIPLFEGPLSKYMCCKKVSTYMKPFFDAYGGPYKDKCHFWTGFLLLVRVILALAVSLDSKATISIDILISLLIVIIFMYHIFKGVYRHFQVDYLEALFILNLMFMAYMTSNENNNSKGQASSIVLVSISFVVFCGIIFYHVWDHLLKSCLCQSIVKVKKIFKKPSSSSSANDLEVSLIISKSPVYENVPPSPSISSDLETSLMNSRSSIRARMSKLLVDMKQKSEMSDTDD